MFCCCYCFFVLFGGFVVVVVVFFVHLLGLVVFLFVFWFFIYLFILGLLISWFAYVSAMWLLDSLVINFFFVVAASGREGCVFSSICVVFLIFFPSGKCYFILLVGGVRDLSSAGQSLTCISILEAYISFEGGCTVLAVSRNHYCIYPKYIFTNYL